MTLQIFAAFVSESRPALDTHDARDHAVARNLVRRVVHPEVTAAVHDEGIDLLERAGIAEELDPFEGRELARLVLLLAASGAASGARLRAKSLEGEQPVFDRTRHDTPAQRGIFFFSASILFAFRNISA